VHDDAGYGRAHVINRIDGSAFTQSLRQGTRIAHEDAAPLHEPHEGICVEGRELVTDIRLTAIFHRYRETAVIEGSLGVGLLDAHPRQVEGLVEAPAPASGSDECGMTLDLRGEILRSWPARSVAVEIGNALKMAVQVQHDIRVDGELQELDAKRRKLRVRLQVGRCLSQSGADNPVVLGRIGAQPPLESLNRCGCDVGKLRLKFPPPPRSPRPRCMFSIRCDNPIGFAKGTTTIWPSTSPARSAAIRRCSK
jgi:hypothetical protein